MSRPPEPTEAQALETVLRAIAPDMRRWVARHLGPEPDLDDATQDALIELACALERFEGRSKLSTYAHRIGVRVALRHAKRHRKRRRNLRALAALPAEGMVTPESVALGREGIARLYAALDHLSERHRTAFVLCDVESLSHDEAAAIEKVSLDTLRKRLHRARVDLRKRLADDPVLGSYVSSERSPR